MSALVRLRIVHLFPDVLRVYGDAGNVMTLVRRAEARSIPTTVAHVRIGAKRIPRADLVVIGGGQDREQATVARELERLGDQLIDLVAGGAALLAVCGGYQNLGVRYRTTQGEDLWCPGLLPVSTVGRESERRLVGPVVARVRDEVVNLGRSVPVDQSRRMGRARYRPIARGKAPLSASRTMLHERCWRPAPHRSPPSRSGTATTVRTEQKGSRCCRERAAWTGFGSGRTSMDPCCHETRISPTP